MRINALSTSAYPPEHSPMAHRLHCYLLALKESGQNVKVYFFDEKRITGEFEGIPYESIDFKYTNHIINSPRNLQRLQEILFPIIKECDIFFHSEDRISNILAIQKVAKSCNTKTIVELNEFPYGFKIRRLDFYLFRLLKQLLFFQYVIGKVGGVIVISKSLELLTRKYNKNVIKIPVLTKHFEIKRFPSNSHIPFILHAGALSENKDGIKVVLEAFNIAQKQLNGNLHLIFTIKKGLPSLLRWIDDFTIKNQLNDKIFFKGVLCHEDLNQLYNDCSLAILNKPNNIQNRNNFPTKLTELLPRKIPVIVSNTGELKEYFKNKINSLVVRDNDKDAIAKAIIQLICNHNLKENLSNKALLLSQRVFYYKNYVQQLSDFFNITNQK
jgi:glycosyltransferase involved in cell wall biosynthesis